MHHIKTIISFFCLFFDTYQSLDVNCSIAHLYAKNGYIKKNKAINGKRMAEAILLLENTYLDFALLRLAGFFRLSLFFGGCLYERIPIGQYIGAELLQVSRSERFHAACSFGGNG